MEFVKTARGGKKFLLNGYTYVVNKKLHALAFVLPDDVQALFYELVNSLTDEMDELLSDFLVYFETTWLGIIQSGR